MDLDFNLSERQTEFSDMVISAAQGQRKPSSLFSAGTGAGKTHVGAYLAALMVVKFFPGKKGALVLPTHQMFRSVHMSKIIGVFQDMGLVEGAHYYVRLSPQAFIFCNGSIISVISGDNPDRIVADDYAWAWLDEPGNMKYDVWKRLIGRMRGAEGAPVYMTGTPEGLNWVYDQVQKKRCNVVYGSSTGNPWLPDSYLADIEQTYEGKLLDAWRDGQFVDFAHERAYYSFDMGMHTLESIPYRPGAPLSLSVDFNVNPMCWVLSQEVEGEEQVFDNASITIQNNANTHLACAHVERKLRELGHSGRFSLYGDVTGHNRDTRSGSDDYAIIRQHLPQAVQRVYAKINPRVRHRVNAVNVALTRGRLIISQTGNRALIQDLQRVVWTDSTGSKLDKVSNLALTHASDALGYLVAVKHPIKINKPWSL